MLIERLDRTVWNLEKSREHISCQILSTLPETLSPSEHGSHDLPPWMYGQKRPQGMADEKACQQLLVALRDGDLHATGRLSMRQLPAWNTTSSGWELHSGHHSHITPEQWRGGNLNWGLDALTMIDGQFIDIRVPRFVVSAIWPEAKTAPPAPGQYTTPYLDLLHRAIAECRITETHQEKKRLPASQRGGAKRASNW